MPALTLLDTSIRQDDQGRFCLNDLHRASGGKKRHQPSDFLRIDQTQALIAEITNSGNLRSIQSTTGRTGGTYACRELVIAYAAWISPAFHLKVLQVFLAATAPARPAQSRSQPDYMREAWFSILSYQADNMVHRALARALDIHEATLCRVLNGSGHYGSGRCSTSRIARRVLRVFCPRQRIPAGLTDMHPEQIKAAMRMKGTTPSALADEMGVANSTVSQVISGRSVSARIQKRISEVTGHAVEVLWPSSNRPKSLRRSKKQVAHQGNGAPA